MSYQLCSRCGLPIINEANLDIFRIRLGVGGVACVVAGGAMGALLLPALGFGSAGISAGSIAASWQGPAVASGSLFAVLQSLGATGLGVLLFGAAGSVAGGVGALGIMYQYRDELGWCGCSESYAMMISH